MALSLPPGRLLPEQRVGQEVWVSEKLGEMLLKVGALTEEQLEQVLSAQSIYGGRLGTNLVEMGLIEEDELARLLNEKLGVPCIEADALDAISEEFIGIIPLEMVQRYHVLPVALNGRRLTLAMADPSDFKAIDEIGFVTGYVIVPRVCSELRLNLSLERHYGIKRAVRYIPVTGGLRSRFAEVSPGASGGSAHPAKEGAGVRSGSGKKLQRLTREVLAERLAGASTEGEVVSTLITYLGGEFDRSAFFCVKGDTLQGVRAVSAGQEVGPFVGCALAIESTEELKRVVRERRFFFGELDAGGADGEFLRLLGAAGKAPALLLPLFWGAHVAAVICVNDEHGRLAGGVFELQRVAAMVQLSFEMLGIRKKIRAS